MAVCFRWSAGALLAAAVAGCQGRGDVSGTVTYQDRPVVYGTVLVVGSDGAIYQGNIEPDGTYAVRDVPTGEARVAVNSPDPTRQLMCKTPLPPDPERDKREAALKARWVALPKQYEDPNTSGLRVQVKRGRNSYPIGLN